ncbi:NAD(P)/FAD-dependent oxidoreductase [Geobacter sp.]|uniref:NAD(P)/FAD-dependent oxidoreductase n=1 Tax=Geobacter sp. TaxID=46610 RepID=UPI001ACEABFA|nr:FAD-dependent oxidoreductase [Geobacter sp.]CAG0995052.1 NADH dehydrogenase [Geobacteraceae bacterium]
MPPGSGSPHLVLVGGGHAHLYTLRRLRVLIGRGIAVTLVTPDRFHYYSGMGPGMLGGRYRPEDIRIDVQSLAEGGGARCVVAPAERINSQARRLHLADGTTLSYDALSLNIGSIVADNPLPSDCIVPVKPIANLVAARERLLAVARSKPPHVLVVGGGAAGVEIAGNVRRLLRDRGDITLVASSPILHRFPPRAREVVLNALAESRIETVEGVSVKGWMDGGAVLSDGRTVAWDLALVATGVKPPALLGECGLPLAPDGSLLVDRFLRSTGSPAVFGGGDCITLAEQPLPRVGVYAVRQGPILFHNLQAQLTGKRLLPFNPQRSFLQLLNLGDDTALLVRNGIVWRGRLAFRLKDFIDRRFVESFAGKMSGAAG